ncbi:unnamed protein product [Urochloa humidicola]
MAGAGRRRRFSDVRIRRRHTWSKQRGAKLRSSSSESDGIPDPVIKTVLRDSDAASKITLKVGGGGCNWSPQDIVEVGGDDADVRYSPMMGCCGCDLVRMHLAVEEGGCEGICALKLGTCDCHGSPKHDVEMGVGDRIEHVRDERNGRHIGCGRLRADPEGQLYVLDSEAEDNGLEQSCRPVLRRCRQCMELWLAGIEEVNREVFIPWIKVALTCIYNP